MLRYKDEMTERMKGRYWVVLSDISGNALSYLLHDYFNKRHEVSPRTST